MAVVQIDAFSVCAEIAEWLASLIDEVGREFDLPDDYGASAAVLSLHEAVLGGVEPTLVVLQGSPQALLRPFSGAGEHPRGRRGRWVLVATEVALAVMLFVGAGLMRQTMWRLRQVDPGFRGRGVRHQQQTSRAPVGAAGRRGPASRVVTTNERVHLR